MSNNTISSALNMAPLPVSTTATPVVAPPPDITTDFETARENIYDSIAKGQEALQDLMIVAKSLQEARPYEVISTLINTLVAANKELLDIHKKHQDLTKTDEGPTKTNITNNLTISSADLLDMIKEKANGK